MVDQRTGNGRLESTGSETGSQPGVSGSKPDCSILIVAYNSGDHIAACLDSIAPAAGSHSYEVLLVDNGDGATKALVERDYPWVRTVPGRGNIGFAAGNNLLAQHAHSDQLLLLNPDMVLYPDAIHALLDGTQRYPSAASWGGVTCDADAVPDVGNWIMVPSLCEFSRFAFGKASKSHWQTDQLFADQRADVLMGGFVMFSRRAWDTAGGLDERFFLYCEEVDLFYRLAKMGEHFWRIGNARGYHAVGHGQQMSEMRLLYRSAGTMEFTRRHWSWPKQQLGFALLWIGMLNRFIAGRLLGSVKPNLAALSESYKRVALNPREWKNGYHTERGLLARISTKK